MPTRAGLLVLLASALLLALPVLGIGVAHAQTAGPDTDATSDRGGAAARGAAEGGSGGGEAEGEDAAPSEPAPKARRSRRGEPPPKVIALEGDEIVGKVPKPQVFYVLGRTPTRYRGLDVRRSFVHKIVESLKRNPL